MPVGKPDLQLGGLVCFARAEDHFHGMKTNALLPERIDIVNSASRQLDKAQTELSDSEACLRGTARTWAGSMSVRNPNIL